MRLLKCFCTHVLIPTLPFSSNAVKNHEKRGKFHTFVKLIYLLSSLFQQQEWLLNWSEGMSACVPRSGVFLSLLNTGLTSYSLRRDFGFWRVFCGGQLCKAAKWAVLRSKVALLSHYCLSHYCKQPVNLHQTSRALNQRPQITLLEAEAFLPSAVGSDPRVRALQGVSVAVGYSQVLLFGQRWSPALHVWKTVCLCVTKMIGLQFNRIQVPLGLFWARNAFVDWFLLLAYVSKTVLSEYTVSTVHFCCFLCRSSIYCNKFYIWKPITNLWTIGLINIHSNILNYFYLPD